MQAPFFYSCASSQSAAFRMNSGTVSFLPPQYRQLISTA